MIRNVLGTGKTFKELSFQYNIHVGTLYLRYTNGEVPPGIFRPVRKDTQTPINLARAANEIKYIDELYPCKKCGGVVKYTVNSSCVECHSIRNENRAKAKQGLV